MGLNDGFVTPFYEKKGKMGGVGFEEERRRGGE